MWIVKGPVGTDTLPPRHSSQGKPAFIGQQPGVSEQKHWFQAPQQQFKPTALQPLSHVSVQ
jgi:hypothetical protein